MRFLKTIIKRDEQMGRTESHQEYKPKSVVNHMQTFWHTLDCTVVRNANIGLLGLLNVEYCGCVRILYA